MFWIIGSEYAKNHAKWYDDKSIYNIKDEESTSSFCTYIENQILLISWLAMIEF